MAGAYTQDDILSRVRREQRTRGRANEGSGLRIVLAATGITVAILLFAFGAIGMLMLARSPQEPIVSKLDVGPPLAPPLAQQNEVVPSAPQAELNQAPKQELETKTVKTLRVIAPPVTPEKNDAVAQQQQVPSQEPETTATIPPTAPQQQQQVQQQVPQRVHQQQPTRQQQAVRREVPKSQADNPLFQLFGIKQYR